MGVTAPFRRLVQGAILYVVAGLVATGPPGGMAVAADDPTAAEAKKHYEEGTKAFNLGEYPRAIAEFKATYNAKPDPLLLYNIAQSYRLAGDAGQALFFYKSFLRNMPAASNRKEVEGRIKALEKQVSEQRKDPGAPPPPPPLVIVPPLTPATAPPAAIPAAPSVASAPASPTTTPMPPPIPTESSESKLPRDATNISPSPPPAPAVIASPTTAPQVDLSTPAPAPEESRPIYKRWWFWAGAVGAIIVVGAVAASSAKKGPNTQLGTYDPSFTP